MTNVSKKFYALPVYKQRRKILTALNTHQVIILESETGSGKTTHIPGILYKQGYSKHKKIAITQPRRIATISVTEFVRERLQESYKLPADYIGYKIRFRDETSPQTKIKIMTDGTLLQEMRTDPLLHEYSIIVIDEAHERSLNIDFVLGLCKNILAQRSDLKLLISSATINTSTFTDFFSSSTLIRINVPQNPITIQYRPNPDTMPRTQRRVTIRQQQQTQKEIQHQHLIHTIKEALKIHNKDMLVFLSGEGDIKDCIQSLKKQEFTKVKLYPLYGRLSQAEQQSIFEVLPNDTRKIIVSTNIAETSVTIDGIGVIIDSGKMKLNSYQHSTLSSKLEEISVSKSAAIQRAGRSGRTGPGVCYRLYSKQDYETFADYTKEEILRTNLSEVLLRMAYLNISNFAQFPYISQPTHTALKNATRELQDLRALDAHNIITEQGRIMSQFPVSPNHSRIIYHAMRTYPDIIRHILIVISFLTSQNPFLLPINQEMRARRAHRQFAYNGDDMLSYILIFENFLCIPEARRQSFCDYHFLDMQSMIEIVNVFEQLKELVEAQGVFVSSQEIELPMQVSASTLDKAPWYHHLRASLCVGLPYFVCKHIQGYTYLNIKGEKVYIHPGSMLSERKHSPSFIVAGEIVTTSKCFARSVTPLTQKIIEDALPHTLGTFDTHNPHIMLSPRTEKNSTRNSGGIIAGTTHYPFVSSRRHSPPYLSLEWKQMLTLCSAITHEQLRVSGSTPCEVYYKSQRIFSRIKLTTLVLCTRFFGHHPRIISYIDTKRLRIDSLFDNTAVHTSTPPVSKAIANKGANKVTEVFDTIVSMISTLQCLYIPTSTKKLYTTFVAFTYDATSHYAQLLVKEHFVDALNISLHSLDSLGDTLEHSKQSLKALTPSARESLNILNTKITKLYHKIMETLSDHKHS